jgi:hypothetical protein
LWQREREKEREREREKEREQERESKREREGTIVARSSSNVNRKVVRRKTGTKERRRQTFNSATKALSVRKGRRQTATGRERRKREKTPYKRRTKGSD